MELPKKNGRPDRPDPSVAASPSPTPQNFPHLPVPTFKEVRGPAVVCNNGIKLTVLPDEQATVSNAEIFLRGPKTNFKLEGFLGPLQSERYEKIEISDAQVVWRSPLPATTGERQHFEYSIDTHGGPFSQWVASSDDFHGTNADLEVLKRVGKAPNAWQDQPC